MDDDLARIAGVLERIAEALERKTEAPSRAGIERLFTAIQSRVADRLFTTSELCEFADLPGAEELREALLGAVGALNPKRIGKRFAKVEGEPIAGYRLRRCGGDRSGVIWQLVRVSENANPPRLA